jgi:hypothetical protein
MVNFDYGASRVREDIAAAQRRLWEHVAAAGSWWTGKERVAIAAEARQADDCGFCAQRKSALSAGAVRGEHSTTGALPARLVDVIHRVRTDPARLSRSWFNAVMGDGLEAPAYVELIGVVTMITGVDYFARSLGVALFPLPEPRPGAPSRRLPEGAKPGVAWVPMIAPEDVSGPEADLYPADAMIPNIARALSLVPAEARMLQVLAAAHYLPVAQIGDPTARRSLDRMQMELVAARVSALNQCFY